MNSGRSELASDRTRAVKTVAGNDAIYGEEITRAAANLLATERARKWVCANEGAAKLSGGSGDLLSVATDGA